MVRLVKNTTDIDNIYTYFEFEGYEGWDDFDDLLSILTSLLEFRIIEKLEGIYSRHCILEANGFIFKLLYHEDFGNCLCNQVQKDDGYYSRLQLIGDAVISKLCS